MNQNDTPDTPDTMIGHIEAAIRTLNVIHEIHDSSAEFRLVESPGMLEIWADGCTIEEGEILLFSDPVAESVLAWVLREIWASLRGSEYAEFNPEVEPE